MISLKDVVHTVTLSVLCTQWAELSSWAGQLSQSQCEEGEGGQRNSPMYVEGDGAGRGLVVNVEGEGLAGDHALDVEGEGPGRAT